MAAFYWIPDVQKLYQQRDAKKINHWLTCKTFYVY